jgi:hypothetical protein
MDTQFETSTDRIEDRLVFSVAEAGACSAFHAPSPTSSSPEASSPSSASAGGASCPRSPYSPS